MSIFGLLIILFGLFAIPRLRAERLLARGFREFKRTAKEFRSKLSIKFRTFSAKYTVILMLLAMALQCGALMFAAHLCGDWSNLRYHNWYIATCALLMGMELLLAIWQTQAWARHRRVNGRIARYPKYILNANGNMLDRHGNPTTDTAEAVIHPLAGDKVIDRSKTKTNRLHLVWSFGLVLSTFLLMGGWLAWIAVQKEHSNLFALGIVLMFVALALAQCLNSILAWVYRKGSDAAEFLGSILILDLNIVEQELGEWRLQNFIPDLAAIFSLFALIVWISTNETTAAIAGTFFVFAAVVAWAFSRKNGRLEVGRVSYRFRRILFYTLPVIAPIVVAWELWPETESKQIVRTQYTTFVKLLFGKECLPVDQNWFRNLLLFAALLGIMAIIIYVMKVVVLGPMILTPGWLRKSVYMAFVVAILCTLVPMAGTLVHLGYNAAGETQMCSWFTPAGDHNPDPDESDATKKDGKSSKGEAKSKPNDDDWKPLDEDKGKSWAIKPPAPKPRTASVIETQTKPKPPKHAPSNVEGKLASRISRGSVCNADFVAMYHRRYGTNPPCVP
jgi:hypothetical protein